MGILFSDDGVVWNAVIALETYIDQVVGINEEIGDNLRDIYKAFDVPVGQGYWDDFSVG